MAQTATDSKQVNVKLTATQHRALRLLALNRGKSLAEVIGDLAETEAKREGITL